MSLDNETGLDKPGIRVRPVTGLVAADYFVPGYFVWAVLIANLARIGYEEKTMYMAAYDWRLSFQNTEVPFFDDLIPVDYSEVTADWIIGSYAFVVVFSV